MKCRQIEELFELSLDGGLSAAQQADLKRHLARCQSCAEKYREAQELVALFRRRKSLDLPAEFFEGYWTRLQSRMEREGIFDPENPEEKPWSFSIFTRRFPWIPQAAAALVLLVVGILIGRIFLPTSGKTGIQKEYQSVRKQSSLSPQLAASTREYIDQSKVLMLALINFDPSRDEYQALNFPRQAEISDALVRQTGDLKGRLADARQQRLLELVEDLEVILLQIANLGTDPDIASIQMIGDGVDERGIIFKIQLLELQQSTQNRKKQTI